MAAKTKKKAKKKAAVKKTATKKKGGSLHAWLRTAVQAKPSVGFDELMKGAVKVFGQTATIRNHFKLVTRRVRRHLVAAGVIKQDVWKTNGTAAKKKTAPTKKKATKKKATKKKEATSS